MDIVANINGISRNVEYGMIDEIYRHNAFDIVEDGVTDDINRVFQRTQNETKVPIWLQDAGLWETWDIIYSTKTIRSASLFGRDMDDYEGIVRMSIDNHEHFIALLNDVIIVRYVFEKRYTWLHVMGLIETWDIITSP